MADTTPTPVTVELTRAQVERVVRMVSDSRTLSVVLGVLHGVGGVRGAGVRASELAELDDPRLSRSLLLGLVVLAALPADGSFCALGEVARATGMHTTTVHRYIRTLLAVGLVERDPESREYRLVGEAPAGGGGR